ncbi:MAG: hypothetical protein PWP74_1643 [Shewanella sp.]|jgi:hypothetical protein|uniref:Uncharacterized protein DUF3149 n=1 Tax=Shewanella fodinae TaxID=552357 RepID=A0A4R2FJP3_9GAMM|nr:hypothetical protein [Shewanella sp.]TCN90559.1 uncharacterized protein DUF3149 [Shewanella fodinae]
MTLLLDIDVMFTTPLGLLSTLVLLGTVGLLSYLSWVLIVKSSKS